MGIFKDYKELYESVQPETPVDKTTSASEIMSLGWVFVSCCFGLPVHILHGGFFHPRCFLAVSLILCSRRYGCS